VVASGVHQKCVYPLSGLAIRALQEGDHKPEVSLSNVAGSACSRESLRMLT